MTVHPLAQGFFLERLAIATALGLAIGFERQWRQRTAGLHTITLVAVGAALFTALPELFGSSDVMRVAAQVVTGVGFLAGGVILREGFNVRGLVTAATLWSTAAVGALAGTGLEFQAMVGAAVIFMVNLFGLPLAELISRIPRSGAAHLETTYTLHVTCADRARAAVRERILHEIHTTSLTLVSMSSSSPADGTLNVTVEMTQPGRESGAADRLQDSIVRIDGVSAVGWEASERTL
ncbi:MAG TPA: MgtC/SapB family protein [Candidatus Acidoferrales bacterium]|nr:MgtC/SapB family protein [Candidatus Acidoferrales bacterium]